MVDSKRNVGSYVLELEAEALQNEYILVIEQRESLNKHYISSTSSFINKSLVAPIRTHIKETLNLGIFEGKLYSNENYLVIPTKRHTRNWMGKWDLKEGEILVDNGYQLLDKELSPGDGTNLLSFQEGVMFIFGNNNVETYFENKWDKGLNYIPALIQLEQEVPERFRGIYLEKIKTLVNLLQTEKAHSKKIKENLREAKYFGMFKTEIIVETEPGVSVNVSKYLDSLSKFYNLNL